MTIALIVILVVSLAANVWGDVVMRKANVTLASATATMRERHNVMVEMRDEMARISSDARYEAREYFDRSVAYEKRMSELVRQNQNLAERIASLRLSSDAVVGGDDMHIDEAVPDKPYSVELFEWIEGLANDETRTLAHDFVLIRRNAHMDDEQILRELEAEWTV